MLWVRRVSFEALEFDHGDNFSLLPFLVVGRHKERRSVAESAACIDSPLDPPPKTTLVRAERGNTLRKPRLLDYTSTIIFYYCARQGLLTFV